MIWFQVMTRTVREALRRPVYLASLLGLPILLMVVFGAALPSPHPKGELEAQQEDELALGATDGTHAGSVPIVKVTVPTKTATPTNPSPTTSSPQTTGTTPIVRPQTTQQTWPATQQDQNQAWWDFWNSWMGMNSSRGRGR